MNVNLDEFLHLLLLIHLLIYLFSFFPDMCRGYVKGQSVDDALARTAYLLDHDLLIPALAELVRTYSRGNLDSFRVSLKNQFFTISSYKKCN